MTPPDKRQKRLRPTYALRAAAVNLRMAQRSDMSERSGASSEVRAERREPGGVQGSPPI